MNNSVRIVMPVVAFAVLTTVAAVVVWAVSRRRVPPPDPGALVVPQRPPPSPLDEVDVPRAACLPGTDTFTELRPCVRQSDCATCTDTTDTACVVVSGTTRPDGTLEQPVTVQMAPPDEPFVVTKPGQYCLPAYLGRCNEFTSNTKLTSVAGRTTWSCECKPELAGLFRQEVEGGSCDVQVACGAQVPQRALVNVGTPTNPQFEYGTVYPNRLTSYLSETRDDQGRLAREPCVVPTRRTDAGDVEVHPDADPTCHAGTYSNRCTVVTNAAGTRTQVLRGSGRPGDPERTRVFPPFATPVPPSLQACPDDWEGAGTPAAPCTNPNNPNDSFVLYDATGREWAGPPVMTLEELRQWWNNRAPWRTVTEAPIGDVVCVDARGGRSTSTTTSNAWCANDDCTASWGTRALPWDGSRDGPLLDSQLLPQWMTNGPYGGQCACDAPDAIPMAQLSNAQTADTWWNCTTGTCKTSAFPNATFDGTRCNCTPTTTTTTPPFVTGMSFNPPYTAATCIADACNPNGVHVPSDRPCRSEADCGGVCVNSACYLPFGDGSTCDSVLDCANVVAPGLEAEVACHNGMCVTRDLARAALGGGCTTDAECSVGTCAAGTCTGGCACARGYHQVNDGGVSPLGLTCESDCVGKCRNGATCTVDPDRGAVCECPPRYTGPNCETFVCVENKGSCTKTSECCQVEGEDPYFCALGSDRIHGVCTNRVLDAIVET